MRALVLVMLLAGCGGSKSEEASDDSSFKPVAEEFAKHLVAHDYAAANALLVTPAPDLQTQYETMVQPIGAISGTKVMQTMTKWPDKQATDIGWAYVAIEGATASEAVTVIVTKEKKIRSVEWGRP